MLDRTLAVIVALLSIVSTAAFGQVGAIGPTGAEQVVDLVAIEIVEETISLDVSVEGNPYVTVHWSASLTSPFGALVDAVDVHMVPESPSELDIGLSIYDFTLTPSDPLLEGTANLSAAPGTPAVLSLELVLDATASVQPRGNSAGVTSDSLMVGILPYYSAEASFVETAVTLKVGERRTFVLNIENRGNAAGDFKVTITNAVELLENGMEVTVSDPTVNIGAGSSRKVDITVKARDDAEVGGYNLQVTVDPMEDRSGNVEGSALLAIDIREAYMSAVQSILGDPIYLAISFIVAVVLLGLFVFGGLRLKAHLEWKRTLKRIRSTKVAPDDRTKGP